MSQASLALLQLCDSLFPVGSFAHSDGLESAVAAGDISSPADVREWLAASLHLVLKETEGPAIRAAFMAATHGDLDALAAIDAETDALRAAASGREATRAMGTRLLRTWQAIRPSAVVDSVLRRQSRYTFPVAFAVVCAATGIGLRETLEAYCYTRLAAAVSAAMRLISLGQHEAHSQLAGILALVPATAEDVLARGASPRSFMPMMDIAAMSHRYVHSRLFRS